MQGIGGGKAEHRLLYTALLYTPEQEPSRSLVAFDLDALAEQGRWPARALAIVPVSDLIAVTDGGNGLEEALQRHRADNVTTILDWYQAAEHLGDFAKVWHGSDNEARQQWAGQAQGVLSEQGGEALRTLRRAIALAAQASAEVVEELRQLIGYLENHRHRTAYPSYRQRGWDMGSGPTEAGCKIIGERLKGSGMRWVEDGAATVAALRALYVSGGKVWGTACGRNPTAPPPEITQIKDAHVASKRPSIPWIDGLSRVSLRRPRSIAAADGHDDAEDVPEQRRHGSE